MEDQILAAGEFKATCLKLMDQVAATGNPVTITKRGKPLVRLVAVTKKKRDARAFFGSLAHCTRIKGDIVSSQTWVYDQVMKFKRIEAGELPIPTRRKRRARSRAV